MFRDSISIQVEVKEAITFTDVDDLNKDQDIEYVGGWFPVYVQLLEISKLPKNIVSGMTIDKDTIALATKHEHNFKRGDKVRLYDVDEYKVVSVKQTIDPKYNNVIRMFPRSRRKYTWSVLELGR